MRQNLNAHEVNKLHTMMMEGMTFTDIASKFGIAEESINKYIPAGELGMFYVQVGASRAEEKAARAVYDAATEKHNALQAGVHMAKNALTAYDEVISDAKNELERLIADREKLVEHEKSIDTSKSKKELGSAKKKYESAEKNRIASEKALKDHDAVRKQMAKDAAAKEKKIRAAQIVAEKALVKAAVDAAKEAVVKVMNEAK